MKTAAGLLLLASAFTASAHYTFPYLIANDNTTGEWQYVRMTANHYSNGPVTDVTSEALRCYEISPLPTTETSTVTAGSTVGFKLDTAIGHPGPLLVYMAEAPSGTTAASLNASGEDWFKIYEQKPTVNASGLQWQSTGKDQFEFTLPSALPDGDYLLRIEHIALHGAETEGGAQFYLACAQLTVTGGGSGSPSPKVAIPGVYKATDPGILIDLYYPIPTNYTMPGPAVWGDSSAASNSTATSAAATSAAATSAAAASSVVESSATAAVSTSTPVASSSAAATSAASSVAAAASATGSSASSCSKKKRSHVKKF